MVAPWPGQPGSPPDSGDHRLGATFGYNEGRVPSDSSEVCFHVARDELTVAKINATVKILEWARDGLEPGVGGTPGQFHVALAEAFRTIYDIVDETVGPGSGTDSGSKGETAAELTGEGAEPTKPWS